MFVYFEALESILVWKHLNKYAIYFPLRFCFWKYDNQFFLSLNFTFFSLCKVYSEIHYNLAKSKHIDTLLLYSCNLRILNEPCINRMLLKDESGVSSIWGIHLQYHFRTSKTKNLLNHKSISFIQAPIQAQIRYIVYCNMGANYARTVRRRGHVIPIWNQWSFL